MHDELFFARNWLFFFFFAFPAIYPTEVEGKFDTFRHVSWRHSGGRLIEAYSDSSRAGSGPEWNRRTRNDGDVYGLPADFFLKACALKVEKIKRKAIIIPGTTSCRRKRYEREERALYGLFVDSSRVAS